MTSQAQSPASVPPFRPLFATPDPDPDDLSSHRHRMVIGVLGLLFPVLLWVIAGLRPTKDLPPWEVMDSVSAYYYTGAAPVFVGVLFVLAVYLFRYRGYKNKYRPCDRCAAIIACFAAIGVASWPSRAPKASLLLPWWGCHYVTIHAVSAVALFGAFIFFSLFLFPKSNVKEGESLPLDKRVRNCIYRLCGLAMLICVIWAGRTLFTDEPVFWPVALALEFSAVSWLVKGRADWTVVNFGRQVLGHRRHPRQLVGEGRSTGSRAA